MSAERSVWMAGIWSSSVKMYVPGAEVAWEMRSARKRGEGDLVVSARWMNGCRAARVRVCAWSILKSRLGHSALDG